MSQTIYTANIKGIGTFRFSADLDRASAPICIEGQDDLEDEQRWTQTQYQTADARHRRDDALRLALRACGREYYADPDDRRDESEILNELLDGVEARVEL